MDKRQELLEAMEDILMEYDIVLLDGLDDAISGYSYDKREDKYAVVYSWISIIDIFMKRDGMNREEAEEFFDFNVECIQGVIFNYDFFTLDR